MKSHILVLAALLICVALGQTALAQGTQGKKSELVVGRIIDGLPYLKEMKDAFERENPNIALRYEPPLEDTTNRSAAKAFAELRAKDEVDVFLGGTVGLHEDACEGKVLEDLRTLDDIAWVLSVYPSDAERGCWVGYYYKYLGVVWNQEAVPSGTSWAPKSFKDLLRLPGEGLIAIPPATGSAARDLLIDLANQDKPTAEAFSNALDSHPLSLAAKDPKLSDRLVVLAEGQPQATALVAHRKLAAAVEWVGDALRLRAERKYACVSIGIPDDARPSLSAFSVRSGRGAKAATFIAHVLGPDMLKKHAELAYRYPPTEGATREIFQALQKGSELAYVPKELRPTAVVREADVNAALSDRDYSGLYGKKEPVAFDDLKRLDLSKDQGCPAK
ncbi:MAG: extracellular solute-binding protein [Pseudomonadota bacterium]